MGASCLPCPCAWARQGSTIVPRTRGTVQAPRRMGGMELGGRKLLVCNCEGTMSLDGKALGRACGGDGALFVNTQLCRARTDNFRAAAAKGAPLLVACTQEQPLFDETLCEAGL